MLKILSGRLQVFNVIDEYASWKYQKHPHIAGAHRSLLIRFVKARRIRSVSDITEQHIAFFVGGELSEFYSEQALKALRQFLWYSRKAGYECIGHNAASRKGLQEQEEKSIVSELTPEVPNWKAGIVSNPWKQKRNRWAGLSTGRWSALFTD